MYAITIETNFHLEWIVTPVQNHNFNLVTQCTLIEQVPHVAYPPTCF